MADETFYRDLVAFADFAEVCEEGHYRAVPDSWDLVITDVEASTRAIDEGRYKEVNAAGVASMVAVRNAMKDLDIPFVFGGDGATILTPSSRRAPLFKALRGLRQACRKNFDLGMRVAVVPIATLRAAGHEVAVARFAASKHISFAMMRGKGLHVGEEWIKDPQRAQVFLVSDDGECESNFAGFQCRWAPVPSRHGVVASVIVRALPEDPEQRRDVYRHVIEQFSKIMQGVGEGRPVAPESLVLPPNSYHFNEEVALLRGDLHSRSAKRLRRLTRFQLRVFRFLRKRGLAIGGLNPQTYQQELVANTDFRKFDNVLRMHIDLHPQQLDEIRAYLESGQDEGELVYGIHSANCSLITCFINSFEGSHAHFVDGADGGYALAAKQIKDRLRATGAVATES